MNRIPLLFMGILATFTSAWLGLVIIPYLQFGMIPPQTDEETGDQFPPAVVGLAVAGRKSYAANGCVYCHSQQIRPSHAGSDIERGWGPRRTVPRDYVHEKPHFLGTMRTGPDLSNIGQRQGSEEWHHRHLYSPRAVSKGSTMPPFRYLYRVQKIGERPSTDAIDSKGLIPAVPEGHELIPTQEAKELVAYLLSLNRTYALKEAPTE